MQFIPFGGKDLQTPNLEAARIVVLPLCYEQAPSYGQGSAEGPLHLLVASEQLETMDEVEMVDWSRLAVHTLSPVFPGDDPQTAVERMRRAAADILDQNKFLLSLGGDHAITIGPVAAAAERFKDLGVLQIDAHLDLRDQWNGSRFNHACVMRRIAEDIGVPFVQVGIRSFSPEEQDYVRRRNLAPFYAHRLSPFDDTWIEQAVAALPRNVYLTVDLDGLDPSVVPGTGTPEPGGLSYGQLVNLIRALGKKRHVVAADINELAKIEGFQVSEYTAAKIATKIFVYCAGGI